MDVEYALSYFQLPPRCSSWSTVSTIPTPVQFTIAETITIQTPLVLKRTPCPAKGISRKSWTEQERSYASQATEVMSLDDFVQEVGVLLDSTSYKNLLVIPSYPGSMQGV